jgi:hypothetical protein
MRSSKATGNKKAERRSLFHKGNEARGRVDDELAKAKAKREARKLQQDKPWRYWLRPQEEGAQVIILDEKPEFFLYEHDMRDPQNPKKRQDPVPCIGEYDTCPVCEAHGREPAYCLFLSVIDLREVPKKDGKGSYEWTRKLFVVKVRSQKKFLKRYDKKGSLRGQVVSLYRSDERTPVIGDEIEFEDEILDEDELSEYVREFTDREGKVHEEDCSIPFDYEEIFVAPTAEELRALVGGAPPAGSTREADDALSSDDGWEDEEKETVADTPWSEDEEKPASRRNVAGRVGKKKRSVRAAKEVEEEEETEDEDEDEKDTAPARSSRRAPVPNVRRNKVRRRL